MIFKAKSLLKKQNHCYLNMHVASVDAGFAHERQRKERDMVAIFFQRLGNLHPRNMRVFLGHVHIVNAVAAYIRKNLAVLRKVEAARDVVIQLQSRQILGQSGGAHSQSGLDMTPSSGSVGPTPRLSVAEAYRQYMELHNRMLMFCLKRLCKPMQ